MEDESSTPRSKTSNALLDGIFSCILFNINRDRWPRPFPVLGICYNYNAYNTQLYHWMVSPKPWSLLEIREVAEALDGITSM